MVQNTVLEVMTEIAHYKGSFWGAIGWPRHIELTCIPLMFQGQDLSSFCESLVPICEVTGTTPCLYMLMQKCEWRSFIDQRKDV